MSTSTGAAVLIVLPSAIEDSLTTLALDHAAFEPTRRVVLAPTLRGYLLVEDIRAYMEAYPGSVAIVLRPDGTVCATLSRTQALSECWLENAFVRARDPKASIAY
jgi:hypothetical protein